MVGHLSTHHFPLSTFHFSKHFRLMFSSWRLPPGVSPSLWDLLTRLPRAYDDQLADTPLLKLDLDFVREHCRPVGSILDLGCGTGRLR